MLHDTRTDAPDTTDTGKSIEQICNDLKESHMQRMGLHRAEKSLTLQIKSLCRRLCDGDKKEAAKLYAALEKDKKHEHIESAKNHCGPFIMARGLLEPQRKIKEKIMIQLVKQLPVHDWMLSVKGLGPLSLAQIIAETGDLNNYSNPAKVWKRMGCGLVGDVIQRKHKDKTLAELHGYNPIRRSIMFVISENLMKAHGDYYDLYISRKEYELARDIKKIQAHRRALRYIGKRLLRELWKAWREV